MSETKLIVHNLASVDGRLTTAPGVLLLFGDPRWEAVAGQNDPYAALIARFQPQAILEGSGSFVVETQESAEFTPPAGDTGSLYQDYLPAKVVDQPGRKWFTAVDSRGRVRWAYKEFPGEVWRGFHLLVLVSNSTPAGYLAFLRGERIPYLVAGEEGVDLKQAFEKMESLLAVSTILSTAGGRLNGALLRAGLIDELFLTLAPALIGGKETPALFDASPLKEDETPVHLELLNCQVMGDQKINLHYRVKREDS